MNAPVDIWLRGTGSTLTATVEGITRAPVAWTDDDVRFLLEGMLRAMSRLKRQRRTDREDALRGVNWLVNPYEDGGVVIAIEVALGAAIAGPFEIDKTALERMIARVLAADDSPYPPDERESYFLPRTPPPS
jgi:hypothetical protein